MDRSGATADVTVVPLTDEFHRPDVHILRETVVNEEMTARVVDESSEVFRQSEVVSVGGIPSNRVECELKCATFDGAVGKTGLISETDTVLDTTVLLQC